MDKQKREELEQRFQHYYNQAMVLIADGALLTAAACLIRANFCKRKLMGFDTELDIAKNYIVKSVIEDLKSEEKGMKQDAECAQ